MGEQLEYLRELLDGEIGTKVLRVDFRTNSSDLNLFVSDIRQLGHGVIGVYEDKREKDIYDIHVVTFPNGKRKIKGVKHA